MPAVSVTARQCPPAGAHHENARSWGSEGPLLPGPAVGKKRPLVGRHGPFHLHKTLGALCVAHFLWRAYCLLSRGEMFPASEPLWLALLGLSLHLALSGSAFLPPLPRTRVEALPGIWPEFRAHSAIFATRHVLATSMSLFDSALFPAGSGEAAPPRWAAAARAVCALVLLLAATGAAARATSALGAKGKSTALAMACPDCVDGDLRRGVQSYYAVCRFGATAACCCWAPAVSFAPLLGIQGRFPDGGAQRPAFSLSCHKAYGPCSGRLSPWRPPSAARRLSVWPSPRPRSTTCARELWPLAG
jgi:hypothetical protein